LSDLLSMPRGPPDGLADQPDPNPSPEVNETTEAAPLLTDYLNVRPKFPQWVQHLNAR